MSNIDELLNEFLSSDCDYDYLADTEIEETDEEAEEMIEELERQQ